MKFIGQSFQKLEPERTGRTHRRTHPDATKRITTFNPPFLIFDIRALWRSGLSARTPECQKLKMVG